MCDCGCGPFGACDPCIDHPCRGGCGPCPSGRCPCLPCGGCSPCGSCSPYGPGGCPFGPYGPCRTCGPCAAFCDPSGPCGFGKPTFARDYPYLNFILPCKLNFYITYVTY